MKGDDSIGKLLAVSLMTMGSLFVVTPLALALRLATLPLRLLLAAPTPSTSAPGSFRYLPVPKTPIASLKPFAEREFYIVLFGATGFTGM